MNVKIQSRNVPVSSSLENLIQRKARKVRKMMPTYRTHDLDLTASLEKLSRGKQYQTSLVISTPQVVMRVEDVEDNITTSVVRAFDDLLRRVERFKSQLNREKYWQKRPALKASAVGVDKPGEVEKAISNNLEKVENFIRRELFHQALIQHFPPGVLQPQALVDKVFLEVSAKSSAKPENISLEQWMFSIARETIREGVRGIERVREEPHLEELSDQEAQWDDEILNFFQPDEALRLEDLLTDKYTATPEEWLEREETEEQIQKAIANLPQSLRESFVLFALEGFNSDEVAMITGKSASEVLGDIEEARGRLRELIKG
jgi:RNA polymerase sigma factor (sigma-70 family)